MEKLSSFLNKFARFGRPDIAVRESVSRSLKEEIGTDIDVKDISIKNGIIHLKNSNSTLKSEIYIRKERILRRIKELSENKNIIDIK